MEQLSPTKLVLSGNDDTMNDEMKIFSQSKRIRELEIVNQKQSEEIDYLREERTKYIEKEHLSNDKIMSYQKLLEELNTQLHQEIDNVSNKQKEILRLKNEILETSSIKAEYRQLEDKHSSVKQQLSKTEESLSKLKTLNSTMIDKQLESQQKLVVERNHNKEKLDIIKNLKLEITSYDDKIKELESKIESETEQNSINKNKIDELISNMNNSSSTSNNEDQYQEMLLSQLKEKKEEIESMKLQTTKLESDVKSSEDKYSSLKAQVSALFNK
jgi:chromosome segregation ATPase